MPNTSWLSTVWTFAADASGLKSVNLEPCAITISCCLFPLNVPRQAWVIADGGSSESEYMNMLLVVAIVAFV